MKLSYDEIKGRTVIDATGAVIGQVESLYVEQASAGDRVNLGGMRVKLRSQVAEDVGMEHGTFRPAVIDVPASMMEAIGDTVLLNVRLDALLATPPEQPAASP